ncbi:MULTISPECIES: avidin/streptavidin family protein [Bradyrhizobium]|uniref:avidin/streptavidin family protein n=1 Tax=Bradyrhizobium elkanii TaxID=29448 RepID=UPI002715585E|nr:avidin/streptavidin family protein [Bradyrhizobium elkanii]WLB84347.1 avidin/streptavidin family protein [Bradyrhizobium elkanii]
MTMRRCDVGSIRQIATPSQDLGDVRNVDFLSKLSRSFEGGMRYRENEMTWVGRWKNQYGSIVEITSEANGRIEGTFRTALADSGFYGQTVAIVGVHQGNCIGFSSVGSSATGDRVVSYNACFAIKKSKRRGLSCRTRRWSRPEKVKRRP